MLMDKCYVVTLLKNELNKSQEELDRLRDRCTALRQAIAHLEHDIAPSGAGYFVNPDGSIDCDGPIYER